MEFLESTFVNQLQTDTIQYLREEDIDPILKRISALEEALKKEVIPPPAEPKPVRPSREQMHLQMLEEMKRRRLFYLRKTPQDLIIEEIMLKHRCT